MSDSIIRDVPENDGLCWDCKKNMPATGCFRCRKCIEKGNTIWEIEQRERDRETARWNGLSYEERCKEKNELMETLLSPPQQRQQSGYWF